MKEKGIFLIRHGKTATNVEGRALGLTDIGLTEDGVEEVKRLALHLKQKEVNPQKIYTSPLMRAKQTAEILQAELGGVIEEADELKEINYGAYENADRTTLREIEYGYNSEKMRAGHGETVEEVEQRLNTFLYLALQTDDASILVVAHAFSASVMSQLLMRAPRTFATIQPLVTADYSYFRVERGGENLLNVLTIQRNCLKGSLSI